MSNQRIAQIAVVVKDYDEAISFYTKKLNFKLIEDTALPNENKRWVVISPPGDNNSCNILLARAKNAEQEAAIGNQTGGRVFFFFKGVRTKPSKTTKV